MSTTRATSPFAQTKTSRYFQAFGVALLAMVFPVEAQTSAVFTSLHSLSDTASGEGYAPYAGVVQGTDGNFYGTAGYGGTHNDGTVFKITPGGAFTTLHSFAGVAGDGAYPFAGLTLGNDGNFYGTTDAISPDANAPAAGTIFKITPEGAFTSVYTFATDGHEGTHPNGGLLLAKDGNFYGTTDKGGASDQGTIFKLTPDGKLTTLYSFTGVNGDGAVPYGILTQGTDGNFYGTTFGGGTNGDGTVYKLSAGGAVTILHSFSSASGEGRGSEVGLVQGTDGNFYGTTDKGGASDKGTVFRITPDGALTVLHSFTGVGGDGALPFAALVQAKDGNFYGTTGVGGADDYGTIFKVTPGGQFTVLHSISGSGTEGAYPFCTLVQGSDGSLYGAVAAGGPTNDGTIIRLSFSTHPSFFSGETSLDAGVYFVQFLNGNIFGYYGYLSDPHYIFHFDLGYEYVFDAADGHSGVYLYDFQSSGFFYTSPTFSFPYLYDFRRNSVVYYYGDPNNPQRYNTNGVRYFYVFNTGQIVYDTPQTTVPLPITTSPPTRPTGPPGKRGLEPAVGLDAAASLTAPGNRSSSHELTKVKKPSFVSQFRFTIAHPRISNRSTVRPVLSCEDEL